MFGLTRALVGSGLLLAVPSASARALAQDAEASHHVTPPPAPLEQDASVAVEIHGAAESPLLKDTICPGGADCVFNVGLGLGVQVERRLPDGWGMFGAYDFWVLDTRGVFEVGTIHAARFGVRYSFAPEMLVHPYVDVALGPMAFGDTAQPNAFGAIMTAGGGAELELTDVVAVVGGLEGWFYTLAPFQTRDGVARAQSFGIDIALQVTVGVSILVDVGVVSERNR
jgi:hypothetical protein